MSVTISGAPRAGASAVNTARDANGVAKQGGDGVKMLPATASPVAVLATEKVSLGAPASDSATYDKPRMKSASSAPSAADMDAMLAESDRQAKAVMDLILPLVEQQGLSLSKLVSGEQHLSADPATIAKAQADIADDGEFGVKQVADRILNFVKAASGGDPTRMAALRDAVEDGFKQAAELFGGALPEISEKTRTVIMNTFDRWASEADDTGKAGDAGKAGEGTDNAASANPAARPGAVDGAKSNVTAR